MHITNTICELCSIYLSAYFNTISTRWNLRKMQISDPGSLVSRLDHSAILSGPQEAVMPGPGVTFMEKQGHHGIDLFV